jgi:hypothetical protein
MIEFLKKWKKKGWDWSTATDFRTHVAHLLLLAAGTGIPALIIHWIWYSRNLTVVSGNLICEAWIYFMVGREVADFIGKKAKSLVAEDMDHTWKDGLGDLAGPLFVRAAWWAALVTLLLGG